MRQWIDRIIKGLWLSALILTTSVLSVAAYHFYESAQKSLPRAAIQVSFPYSIIDSNGLNVVIVHWPLTTSDQNDMATMFAIMEQLDSAGEPYFLSGCYEATDPIRGKFIKCSGIMVTP